MEREIFNKYQEIINELKIGNRGLFKLEESLKKTILSNWANLLTHPSIDKNLYNEWEALFCVVNHTANFDFDFLKLLKETFFYFEKLKVSDDLWIFFLGAFEKHVLTYFKFHSMPVDKEYLTQLNIFLKSKNPEVLEWVLRVIESLEDESIYFEKEILNLRPSIIKIFNQHQRMSFQIIELLNKKWAHYRARGLIK